MAVARSSRRVALLRGINVGGAGLLKMADLRQLAARVGFGDVQTVGASGNLVYRSDASAAVDAKRLTDVLLQRMGKATVVIRTATQMRTLVGRAPFAKPDPTIPDKWKMVTFLPTASKKPLPEVPPGDVRIDGRTATEVFYVLLRPSSTAIGMAARLERSLGVSVTVRNWNVVRLLARILDEGPA